MTFEPGKSGNPGGRVKGRDKLAAEKFLPYTDAAVKALVYALSDPDKCVSAAKEILDRVYGKATQSHDLGETGDKIINQILEVASKK